MSIKDIILDSYVNRVGVTREVALANMDKFSYNVSGIESKYGTDLINKDGSSARGIYQFLTKGDDNAYQTGLNRLSNSYKQAGKKPPTWLLQARKDNDPIKLTKDRQEEVMLANIYQQNTSDLTGMLEGDQRSGMDLYLNYHHTDPSDVPTATRALDFFKPAPLVPQEQSTQQQKPAPEFEDRINNPQNYPVIQNEDGTHSTHRMAANYDEETGKWYVYPTIVDTGDGKLFQFEDTDAGNFNALKYAILSGNNYEMDKESALAYAKGGYKLGTPLDPALEQEQTVDVNASALDPEVPAQQSSHTVAANDTLYKIAKASGMSLEDLQAINPEVIDHTNLQLGQQLRVGNGWFEQL